MKRSRNGQFAGSRRLEFLIGYSVLGGILLGIFIDAASKPVIYVAEAEEVIVEQKPQTAMIEIAYSEAGIERLIREAFPETPNTAVAIVKAEGGLVTKLQSQIIKNGVQEPSFCAFQIHEPLWDKTAKRLGYGDYKTNVEHCIKMARYIYDAAGQEWTDWSAYNNGSYKTHL